jgi:plasmid stabilization system protein ParE
VAEGDDGASAVDDGEAQRAAEQVLDAVRAAVRGLEAIPDAGVRARAAGLVLRAWKQEQALPSAIRQQAVDTLHQGGMDFPEIGEAIGVDRSRAWRIWRGL